MQYQKTNANANAIYQQNNIMTASKNKLLLMLYDGAIKFLRLAKVAIDKSDIQESHNNIIKTENILSELMSTLNMEYDISKDLYSLYDYMKYRLTLANVKKDTTIIDEILTMLVELREAWQTASVSL